MKEFFADYFLSFVSHKHAKNIYKRSFFITFINIIIMLVAVLAGQYGSQQLSFAYHFDEAIVFHQVLDKLFTDQIVIKGGNAEIAFQYNSYVNDYNDFKSLEYEVIVDTRDKETTYEDFILTMTTEDGASVVSYTDYLLLSVEEKTAYHAVINRTGVYLDTVANIATYEAYLDSIEDKTIYLQLKDSYQQGNITEQRYADLIYIEYAKNYYPSDVTSYDSTGDMPTMYSYYCSLLNNDFSSNDLLFIYDNTIEGSFVHNGHHYSFFGTYSENKTYNLAVNKENTIRSFILESYKNGNDIRLIEYGIIAFLCWFAMIVILLIWGFIVRAILRIKQRGVPHYLVKILNLNGSFILYSSMISLIGVGFAGFFLSKEAAIVLMPVSIILLVIARSVVHYSIEKKPSDYIAED